MPVSSMVVRAVEGEGVAVAKRLRALGDAALEVTDERGDELVIVTQTDARGADKDIWNRIESTPGVLGLDLIYHNFEDLQGDDG